MMQRGFRYLLPTNSLCCRIGYFCSQDIWTTLDLCKTTTRLGALRDYLISEQLLFLRRKQYQADVTLDGWHCFLFLCLCNSVRLAAGRQWKFGASLSICKHSKDITKSRPIYSSTLHPLQVSSKLVVLQYSIHRSRIYLCNFPNVCTKELFVSTRHCKLQPSRAGRLGFGDYVRKWIRTEMSVLSLSRRVSIPIFGPFLYSPKQNIVRIFHPAMNISLVVQNRQIQDPVQCGSSFGI